MYRDSESAPDARVCLAFIMIARARRLVSDMYSPRFRPSGLRETMAPSLCQWPTIVAGIQQQLDGTPEFRDIRPAFGAA